MKPEDLDRLYHLEQENKSNGIKIRPLEMEDCEENQKKERKDERKDFDARWEQPPIYFSRTRKAPLTIGRFTPRGLTGINYYCISTRR